MELKQVNYFFLKEHFVDFFNDYPNRKYITTKTIKLMNGNRLNIVHGQIGNKRGAHMCRVLEWKILVFPSMSQNSMFECLQTMKFPSNMILFFYNIATRLFYKETCQHQIET